MQTDSQESAPAAAEATDQKPTDQQLATTQPRGVPLRMGMAPTSVEEGWRLSQFIAQSDLAPKGYKNKPADVLIAIQYGMELGFAPMQALASIAVIGGRPSVWGDGFLALLMSSPLYADHDEHYEVAGEARDGLTVEDLKRDDTAAVCTFWRRGKATPVTRRFTIGQAKKAGLLGKQGPWTDYPDRMMAMRARSWAGRDTFPDLLRGITTAEEARDLPPADAIEIAPVQPRRASETTRPPAPAEQSSTQAVTPSPRAVGAPTGNPSGPNAGGSGQRVDGPAQELRGLLVTNTQFVRPNVGEPYYLITTQDTNGLACEFVTREEGLYKEAASFEGSEHRIVAGFHTAPKAGTEATVRVLDTLAIFEGPAISAPAAATTGELFG